METNCKLKLSFGKITAKNLEQLKMINLEALPVHYKHEFYMKVISLYQQYTYLVYFNDYAVGCISCRIEERDDLNTCYILIYSILQKYRKLGIGRQMMQFIIEQLSKENPEVTHIFLHVQTSNQDALQFYSKMGFEQQELIKDYYKDLDVNDCYLLKKELK